MLEGNWLSQTTTFSDHNNFFKSLKCTLTVLNRSTAHINYAINTINLSIQELDLKWAIKLKMKFEYMIVLCLSQKHSKALTRLTQTTITVNKPL